MRSRGDRRVAEAPGERRARGCSPRSAAAAQAARGRDRAPPRATPRIAGSSCCITRDRRVSPAVSSVERGAGLRRRRGSRTRSAVPRAASIDSGADAGQRVEQRREEQLLVDRAHDRLVALVRRRRTARARSRSGRSRKPSTRARWVRALGVGRERVGLVLVDELQPVLDGAEPYVRLVEAPGVVRASRSRRPRAARARRACERARIDGSWRPCTSCSSCTANSMSRMPP